MGSIDGIAAMGLGPMVLGLGVVALLGAVPWIVKLVLRSKMTRGSVATADEEAFDADAALARYMARKVAAGDDQAVTAETGDEAIAAPQVFGRKVA